jgi:hypothetical protein
VGWAWLAGFGAQGGWRLGRCQAWPVWLSSSFFCFKFKPFAVLKSFPNRVFEQNKILVIYILISEKRERLILAIK